MKGHSIYCCLDGFGMSNCNGADLFNTHRKLAKGGLSQEAEHVYVAFFFPASSIQIANPLRMVYKKAMIKKPRPSGVFLSTASLKRNLNLK